MTVTVPPASQVKPEPPEPRLGPRCIQRHPVFLKTNGPSPVYIETKRVPVRVDSEFTFST